MSNPGPSTPWGQQYSPAGPPPPSQRRTWLFVIAAVVVVVAVAAGVTLSKVTGHDAGGEPPRENARPTIDLGSLDIGSYDVTPRQFAGPPTLEEARNVESFNLAQWIVPAPDVFPALTYINGLPTSTPDSAATAVSANGNKVIQPVLEKYGMVSGFLLQGFAKPLKEYRLHPGGGLLNILVTSFPGAEQARQAATDMEATDFAVNPGNVPVPIPGYPDAHAHWLPGITTIGVTLARKTLVVSIFLFDPGSTTADLLGAAVQRILDVQAPLLDRAASTPEPALTMRPIDPDHMLSRVLIKGPTPPIGATFLSVAGSAVIICESSPIIQQNLYGIAGVDRCAGTQDGIVRRTRDDAAAKTLVAKLTEIDPDVDHKIPGPQGVPDSVCSEQKPDSWKDDPDNRFNCSVTYGRYAASVRSGEEKDVMRRAAAQYALLVNNE